MIKTSEASGAILDYWAAVASGIPRADLKIMTVPRTGQRICVLKNIQVYDPSSSWATGGPLLGRMIADGFGISKNREAKHGIGEYVCGQLHGPEGIIEFGDTPLMAVCRALVLQRLGAEVQEVQPE